MEEEHEGSTHSGESSREHSLSSSPVPEIPEEQICGICTEKYKQPRILDCLHIFCTECLESKLLKDPSEDQEEGETGEEKENEQAEKKEIVCEKCQQVTNLSEKGVSDLSLDHVMVNILDMSAIEDTICTSCKAKEKAVARCSDCANFLCPNCVTAHQYMRCFENHKVVSFEDMQNGEGLAFHKPLFCVSHPSENMKYFCNTCQVPICNECMIVEHKQPEHSYERINDVEEKQKQEIQTLVTEAKDKIDVSDKATCDLQSCLSELEAQSDQAKGLVEETFQSYKALLEKRKEQVLEELEKLHKDEELSIMESINKVEKNIEKIEDGTVFAERIMEHGNLVEILLMKRVISSQLLSLVNTNVKPEVKVDIEFQTDLDKFDEAMKTHFGHFKKNTEEEEGKVQDPTAASLHSSFENEGINLPPGLLNPESSVLSNVTPDGDFLADLPLSLGNINVSVSPLAAAGVSPQTINSIANSLQSLSGVGTERSSSRNSYSQSERKHSPRKSKSPAMSDSGISVDAASNGSSYNQQTNIDVGALAKHGTLSVNAQGQITLNGQVLPGLTVNNVVGLPPSLMQLANRSTTPTTPAVDPALTNLFGVGGLGVSTTRSVTPSPLGDISSLLANSSSSGLNPLPSLGGSNPNLLATTGILGAGGMPLTPSHFNFQSHHGGLPSRNPNKMSAMQIKCKFGQLGPGKGQFNSPHGFCMGLEEDIIVADTNNHRIQVFEKSGEFKYQFGIPGKEEGQLWYPRKVAVIRSTQKYVVCDRGNERSRMQIFTKNGHFVKKIAIRYIDIVAGLAITSQGYIVAVDSVSPTVFVINPETATGDLVRWFDCSDYMREPSDIAVNGKEYYVCDFKGHCVVVFNEDGQFVRRIGCENITNFPNGIDISDAGDVLIGDSHGNRFHVAVFQRDGSLIGEFECPYVKVSRCCGLKITLEGYIVTLAKNNHHVLVLHTLYID